MCCNITIGNLNSNPDLGLFNPSHPLYLLLDSVNKRGGALTLFGRMQNDKNKAVLQVPDDAASIKGKFKIRERRKERL